MWVWLIYTLAVMLKTTASAVSTTVGLQASITTTCTKISLKCMYMYLTNNYKVTYHNDKWIALFKNISGENLVHNYSNLYDIVLSFFSC